MIFGDLPRNFGKSTVTFRLSDDTGHLLEVEYNIVRRFWKPFQIPAILPANHHSRRRNHHTRWWKTNWISILFSLIYIYIYLYFYFSIYFIIIYFIILILLSFILYLFSLLTLFYFTLFYICFVCRCHVTRLLPLNSNPFELVFQPSNPYQSYHVLNSKLNLNSTFELMLHQPAEVLSS